MSNSCKSGARVRIDNYIRQLATSPLHSARNLAGQNSHENSDGEHATNSEGVPTGIVLTWQNEPQKGQYGRFEGV